MRTMGLALATLLAFAPLGLAATKAASPKQQAQQQKMKDCNAQADTQGLKGAGKGAERQAFMKTCLGAGAPAATAKTTQQDKMKQCNADATTKALKGAERKTFMSSCLSAH